MARKKTLSALLDDYRAECRLSLNVAHNAQVRETQVKMLRHKQEWLWNEYDWPHLNVSRQYALQSGQRFYDFTEDFDMERINRIEVKIDGAFVPLAPSIDACDYLSYDSDLDDRSWPAQRWRIGEDDQVEVWPIPSQNGVEETREGYLKVTGIRRLKSLVEDTDRADLDDRLIVLYAAAEHLAAAGSKDAKLKLDAANALLLRLRGGLTKKANFQMFGVGRQTAPRRRIVTQYRPAGS